MEFSKLFLQKMAIIKSNGTFYDYNLRSKVFDKVSEQIYNETLTDDIASMYEYLEECTDDDEYYNCIHCLAQWLEIEK